MRKKILSQSLIENAIDSLEEGLTRYESALDGDEKSFKYAILSISHYIELSFKFFVTRISPLLIYKNPFSDTLRQQQTISMWEAVNFVKHSVEEGILESPKMKSKDVIRDLEYLKNIRNDIEHHKFDVDKDRVDKTIGKVLSVLHELYELHDEPIQDRLPSVLEDFYGQLIDDYKRKLLVANKTAASVIMQYEDQVHVDDTSDRPDILSADCSRCGNETLVFDEESYNYQCTFCHNTEAVVVCQWCDDKFPYSGAAYKIEINEIDDNDDTYVDDENSIYFCSKQCRDSDMRKKLGD